MKSLASRHIPTVATLLVSSMAKELRVGLDVGARRRSWRRRRCQSCAAAAATVVQGASALERWLLEQVVSGALEDMGAYIRDAVEEQAEEEAWLDDVAPGRPDTRRARWDGGSSTRSLTGSGMSSVRTHGWRAQNGGRLQWRW